MPDVSIECSLVEGSILASGVKPGIQAVKGTDRHAIDRAIRRDFRDSLNLDGSLASRHPDEPRWDYLLAHRTCGIVALEIHPARNGEIQVVIAKKRAAARQLRPHLKRGTGVQQWHWVASGTVALDPLRAKLRLAAEGIGFAGRCLSKRHLQS